LTKILLSKFFFCTVATCSLVFAGCGSGSGSKPQTPVNVTATAGNAEVTLAWSAVTGAASYNVYRTTASGGEANAKPVTGITDTGFVDVGLTNGTKYFYEVAAVSSGGATSALSQEVSSTPQKPPVPATPANLTATPGGAQVTLSWIVVPGATSYNIYRGVVSGGESPSPVGTGVTGTSYTDSGLTNWITYFYVVSAVNASGTGGPSNEASAMPYVPLAQAPGAPASLTAAPGNSLVALSWSAVSGATSYNVYLGTAAGQEGTTPVATEVTGTGYTDTAGITNGTTYYYVVAAVNNNSPLSAFSNEVSATPSSSYPPTAVRANDFLNTMGVVTHLVWEGGSSSQDGAAAHEIGFRHIRDGCEGAANWNWTQDSCISTMISFHQQYGITFDDGADLTNQTPLYEDLMLANAGALFSIEGPNEPNNFPVTWNGQTSSETGPPYWNPIAGWQQTLYRAVKGSPTLTNYPIFGISESGAEVNDVGLQWLIIPPNPPDASTLDTSIAPIGTGYADYANLHNYVDGVIPNCGLSPNDAWYAEGTTKLDYEYCNDGPYVEYGVTWNEGYLGNSQTQLYTLPRVTTETNWSDQSTANGGDGLTDDQIGRNLMDLFLDATKEGWSYTFIYDLVEGGDGFGLVNDDYSLKTSAVYLQNFTTILADTSSNFTPATLNYLVPNEPVTVHDLLLQKSDGTLYIAVWDEETIGSGTTDTITVDLGGNYNVAEYDPTQGTTPTTTLTNVSSVTLTGMSESPILLQLSTP